MDQTILDAITRAASEAGLDPAFALAVAQRESDFRVNAPSSKTINGLFQMTRAERLKWGGNDPDSMDPYAQSKMWGAMVNGELKPEMTSILGRDPTPQELYLGHYFGSGRAARMINGQISGNTPVQNVFSWNELRQNPNIIHAGTVGNLTSSINGDIANRMDKFGPGITTPSTDPSRYDIASVQPAPQVNNSQGDYYKSREAINAGAESDAFTNAPTQGSGAMMQGLTGLAHAVEGLEGGNSNAGDQEAAQEAQQAQRQMAAGEQNFAQNRQMAAYRANAVAAQPVALPGNEVPLAAFGLPTPSLQPGQGTLPTVLGQSQQPLQQQEPQQ